MRTDIRAICAAMAAIALMSGVASAADDHKHKEPAVAIPSGDTGRHEPGMHMHKSDITHTAETAIEFKGEASQLRAQAESHRKLAKLYRGRTASGKGAAVNFDSVAKHCENLAKAYDDAAKAAEAAATELAK
jgi:hypothetical protein